MLDAIGRIWKRSVFEPTRFFRGVDRHVPLGPAVFYYLGLGILVAGVGLFWSMVLPPPDADNGGLASVLAGLRASEDPLLDFLFSPLALLFALFIGAALIHATLRLLGAGKEGFGTTTRVLCYAYSPQLFAVVPFIGPIVAAVWSLIVTVIGLREAHATTTGRAIVALVLPLFLLIGMVVMLAMLVAAGSLLTVPV